MNRRAGMTTTEVLVALFIMALGVIAILTLFPLGMLNMGQALKDDRVAQSASTADGVMRTYWKTYVVENQSDTNLSTSASAFDNPGSLFFPALNATNANEASYPVFVDPIGYIMQGAPITVGNSPTSVPIPRRSLVRWDNGTSATAALRLCSLTDGITYGMNGQADNTTGSIERDMRYNWLWVLQRPVNKYATTVTMQVVVFERRAPRFYATGVSEAVFTNIAMAPNTTTLVLPLNSGVLKGSWIMDGTTSGSMRHANFYRVASATDNGSGQYNVELETNIRRGDGQTGNYTGTIVVLAGVADVFTRADLTP